MGSNTTPAVLNNHGFLLQPPPQWRLENMPPQNPRDLQEHQLVYMTDQLNMEVSEHNKTRERLQRYLGQALAHERALCTEQGTVQYLSSLVQELRMQVQTEQANRGKAEDELREMVGQKLVDYERVR